jgi:hypothetical protein
LLKRIFILLFSIFVILNDTSVFAEGSTPNEGSIRVLGKIVEVNGSIISLEVPPTNVNGTMLVPLRPIFDALGLHLDWNSADKTITGKKNNKVIKLQVDNTEALVDNKRVTLEVPPKIINGNTMVPLRFLGESCGAKVEYTHYPVTINRTITDDEKSLMSAYNDALYIFNVEKQNYKQDLNSYNNAAENALVSPEDDTPVYYITGDVISRDPFVVFGVAVSHNAPLDDPGYVTTASNILIQNPQSDRVMFNKYVQGVHYYKNTTTTKSVAGFTVPLYIFGDVPDDVKRNRESLKAQAQNQVNSTSSATNATQRRMEEANDSLNSAKDNLEKYIIDHFESVLNENPNNLENYVDYIWALYDTADDVKDKSLVERANDILKRAIELSKSPEKRQTLSILLSKHLKVTEQYSSGVSSGPIKNAYKEVINVDPYILLNYAESDYQKYKAAEVFSELKMLDKAEYLVKQIKDLLMSDQAKSELEKLKPSAVNLTSSAYSTKSHDLHLKLTFDKPVTLPSSIDIKGVLSNPVTLSKRSEVSTDGTNFYTVAELKSVIEPKSSTWHIVFHLGQTNLTLDKTAKISLFIYDKDQGINLAGVDIEHE